MTQYFSQNAICGMERNYGLYVCQCDSEAMRNYPDINIQIGENVYTLPKESYIHKVTSSL